MSDVTEYPMTFPELPYYLKVIRVVDHNKNNVSFRVESRIHVSPIRQVPNTYSIEYANWRPEAVREDVLNFIIKVYGLRHYSGYA